MGPLSTQHCTVGDMHTLTPAPWRTKKITAMGGMWIKSPRARDTPCSHTSGRLGLLPIGIAPPLSNTTQERIPLPHWVTAHTPSYPRRPWLCSG